MRGKRYAQSLLSVPAQTSRPPITRKLMGSVNIHASIYPPILL